MNLREKIEQEITDKVMTKLASERVELGKIDDLKKNLKKAIDELKLTKFEVSEGERFIKEKKNIANYINFTEPKVKTINNFYKKYFYYILFEKYILLLAAARL